MGGGSFVPKQQNWIWAKDDAAQPTDTWESENTTFTMSDNSDILRLRFTINETGGKAGNNLDWSFEYSTNDADWNTPGADQAWNYANGAATEGNTLQTNWCTDTSGKGIYIETDYSGSFDIAASTSYELDYAITPGTGVVGSTLYYFRILIDDAEVVLNSGETHANCTTAAAAIVLTVPDTSHTLTQDSIALTQAHTLAMNAGDHALSQDAIALTQVHTLVVAAILHALSQDAIALTQVHNITLSECAHAHAVDGISLTQAHRLTMEDATHEMDGTPPDVEPDLELIVNTGLHMTMFLR